MIRGRDTSYRFVGVQIPIADLRGLRSAGSMVARPSWPLPQVGADFMRGIGVTRGRPRGNPLAIEGEQAFVDLTSWLTLTGAGVLYARLFGTAVGYRIDVGLRASHWGNAREIAKHVARVQVDFETVQSVLLTSGEAFSRAIARRTTRQGIEPDYNDVVAGRPLILIEGGTRKDVNAVRAHSMWVGKRQDVPVWALSLRRGHFEENRQLRAAIWRLHFEHEILGLILSRRSRAEPEALLDYLEHTTRLLARSKRDGVDQHLLRSIAARVGGWRQLQLESALAYLRGESKGIARRIDIMLERSNIRNVQIGDVENLEVTLGDTIRAGKNAQIINRSPSAVQVSKSAETTIQSVRVDADVADAMLALLDEGGASYVSEQAELANAIRAELAGEARPSVIRNLWQRLINVSPALAVAIEGTTLIHAFLTGNQ